MSQSAPTTNNAPADVLRDCGLHCPHCRYNLTGLTSRRCPECGREIDWDRARWEAQHPPQIAFERASGLRIPLGWLLTWLTVLFVPWVFARQITQRVKVLHALFFAGVCFATTCSAVLIDATWDVYFAWLLTAAIYIILQTLGLAALDFAHWRQPTQTLLFWCAAGCYTSAIMTTEIIGPPMIVLHDLQWYAGIRSTNANHAVYDQLYAPTWAALIAWSQMGLWLLGIACIYAARLRAGHFNWRVWGPMSTAVALLGLLGYAAAVQHIGYHLLDWMGL